MITKTQLEIIKIFTSKISKKFSINEITLLLKKPYPLIHRSIKPLIEKELILIDEKKLLSLNYEKSLSEIVFAESIRTSEKLE